MIRAPHLLFTLSGSNLTTLESLSDPLMNNGALWDHHVAAAVQLGEEGVTRGDQVGEGDHIEDLHFRKTGLSTINHNRGLLIGMTPSSLKGPTIKMLHGPQAR
jgi:hypothetical protein